MIQVRSSTALNILDRSIPAGKLIFSLVIPSFIGELMQILTFYVDTAMVGRIGVNATASVAVNMPVLNLSNGLSYGLALGFTVMIARFIGESNMGDAGDVVRNAMFHVVWFGGLMTVLYVFIIAPNFVRWMKADPSIWASASAYMRYLGYSRVFVTARILCNGLLRGMGDNKKPMLCDLTHNLFNIVLNFLLIYPTREMTFFGEKFTMIGAGYGVEGAAIATSAANVCSGCLSFFFLFKTDNKVHVDLKRAIAVNFSLLKRVYRLGLPIAVERLVINSGQLATTRMLAGLGNSVVAAHNLANTAESMCYMPVNGFGVAATTLVAQWLGAGDSKRAKELGNICVKYACTVMSVCAGAMFVFAPDIIGIFTGSRAVIDMASRALRVQAFAEIFVAITMTTGGILRGAGDTNYSSVLTIAGMWGVRVPLAYILIGRFGFGLLGVWLPMALDWTARCILMTVRYRRGKWLKAWKV